MAWQSNVKTVTMTYTITYDPQEHVEEIEQAAVGYDITDNYLLWFFRDRFINAERTSVDPWGEVHVTVDWEGKK